MIGAGPAGIAAVGRLLDRGIPQEQIAWVDPAFRAGDVGAKWRPVSSNTIASTFLQYLHGASSFRFSDSPPMPLREVDPDETCALALVADPLLWVTEQLRERVAVFETTATTLRLEHRRWRIETGLGEIASANTVLAVGAVPKKLDYPQLQEIPVEVALDPEQLREQSLEGATVAVFGSSHSSMIALPHLLRHPVAKVINFYRSPLKYAVYLDNWILFDDTGLKGRAAQWARENIDGVHPERLERYRVSGPEFEEKLSECDRVVYTVGFERRALPNTPQWGTLGYNPQNGIIAPGLFGLGIAFPEYAEDPYGYGQYRVGLKKFMDYLDAVLPLWMVYGT
ncbi:pyridine nucleotide-disulfide oxidoreductase [Mycobacterium vicinigordonae]|uniref:Pyridine nucleotide-disulfide oxidoreductase n=1 Tax=Mycobacterium vicinigordonae TaxID=1719132 RepID=A0A7D6E449_9MYCO|nr:pyridine nucleotide-disulfide oxidoreductase [Mycobacterium vicinigordonae]QLL10350.1 pyridine nucleotide-disulfide oxidoreductase [Mycobacterium vicinigordonae]